MMDATRSRLSFTGESIAVAALLLATIVVGALVVREFRLAPRALGTTDVAPSSAPSVPADAVSVPSLALGPAIQIKVGERLADAVAQLEGPVTLVSTSVERGPLGPREIRNYVLQGTKFTIVAEPFERRGDSRIASIYLQ